MILLRGKRQYIPPKRHTSLPNYTVSYPRMSTDSKSVSLLTFFFFFFFFRHWTSFTSWKLRPSQRHFYISLELGRRLSNFWPSFGKCPVWRYPPICTWVFLVIFCSLLTLQRVINTETRNVMRGCGYGKTRFSLGHLSDWNATNVNRETASTANTLEGSHEIQCLFETKKNCCHFYKISPMDRLRRLKDPIHEVSHFKATHITAR